MWLKSRVLNWKTKGWRGGEADLGQLVKEEIEDDGLHFLGNKKTKMIVVIIRSIF